jgi:tRNA 2-thiouridine synthesizing protein A
MAQGARPDLGDQGHGGGTQDRGAAARPATRIVDCLGLYCPMPLLRLAAALAEVAIGERVDVLADDPAAKVDVPVWCRTTDQIYLGAVERPEGGWVLGVRRAQ